MQTDYYTIDDMLERNWTVDQADDYYSRLMLKLGYSQPEVNGYLWSADNLIHQRYAQARPEQMRKYYADKVREPGIMRYFQQGFQNSLVGLYMRDSLPDAVSQEHIQNAGLLQRTAMAIGGAIGDLPGFLPSMLLGAVTGGLGTAAIGGANFAAVDGLKAAMMYDLVHGTHGDPNEKRDEVLKAAVQGGVIGTFLPGAKYLGMKGALKSGLAKEAMYREGKNLLGQEVKSLAGSKVGNAWAQVGGVLGETAWMGTGGPLLEGRLPQTQDYVDNLTFLAGMHAIQSGARGAFRRIGFPSGVKKMMDSEIESGLTAQEQATLASRNPNYKVELLTPERYVEQKEGTVSRHLKEKYDRLKAASILYEDALQNGETEGAQISSLGMLSAFMQDLHKDGVVRLDLFPAEDQAKVVELCGTEMIRDEYGTEVVVLKNVEPLRKEMDRIVSTYKPSPYTARMASPAAEYRRHRENDPTYAAEAARDSVVGGRGLLGEPLLDRAAAEEYAGQADERATANRENLIRQSQIEEAQTKARQQQINQPEAEVETSSSDDTITKVRTPEETAARLESQTLREQEMPTGNVDQATESVATPTVEQEQVQARREEINRQLDEAPNVGKKVQRTLRLEDLARPVTDFLVGNGMNRNWARAAGMLEAASAEHMCKWFDLTPEQYMEQRAPKIVWDRINKRRGPNGQRGSYTPLTDEKGGVIDLFEGFDASTPLHELSHHWFDEIIRAAKINPNGEAMRILRVVADAYNKDVSEIMKMEGDIWTHVQERWAKDYEHWLNTANVRDPALAGIFGQIKIWMKSIYQTLKDLWQGTGWEPNAEVQKVFDKLLLGENRGLKTTVDRGLYDRALEVLMPEHKQVNVGGRKAGEAVPVQRERGRGITVGGEDTVSQSDRKDVTVGRESLDATEEKRSLQQINVAPTEAEATGGSDGTYGPRTGRTIFQSAVGKAMDEVQTKASLVATMANALGLHVIYRKGRSASSLDVEQGVVNLRGPKDLDALLTAAGPKVAELAWGDNKAGVVQNNIQELAKYSDGKGKQTTDKQLGRFVSEFVTAPEKAKVKAPGLYREMEAGLRTNHDDLLQIFEGAKRVLDDIENQPGTARVKNGIVFGKEKKWTFKDLFSREGAANLYRSVVDESFKVTQLVNGWKKEVSLKGLELAADQDPIVLMANLKGTAGLVNHFVEFGTFSFKDRKINGESYMQIIRDAEALGDLKDLSAYMAARRGKEMHSRVDKDGNPRRIESGFTDKEIEDTLKEQAKFKDIADRIDAFEQRVLEYVKDAGLIDEGTMQLIQSLNKAYVPFQRVFMREGGWASGQKAMGGKPIKTIRGSTTEIYDPLQTIITNAYVMIHAAERNNVLRSIADLSKMSETGAQYVYKEKNHPQIKQISVDDLNIDEASKNLAKAAMSGEAGQGLLTFFQAGRGPIEKNKIVVWRDGKAEVYSVHDSIGELFNDITPENVGIFTRMLGAPFAKMLRKGATLTLDFAGRNIFRDTLTTGIVSENKFIPFVDSFNGLVHVLRKDATYQAFIRSGGAQSCMVSADRNTAITTMDMLRKTGFMDKVWNVVKDPLEAMARIAEISENATRVGEFAKTYRADLDPDRATMMKAGYDARSILDYARQGKDVKGLSSVVAFFNPNVQGVDKMFRSVLKDPMRFAARTALYVAAPSILLALRNYGDEDIDEIPKSQRDLFWMVKFGEGDNKFILRVPKPFEAGVLFGSTLERTVEFCMDVMNEKNGGDIEKTREQAFRGLGASIWDNLHPNIVPTAANPIVEHWANKSTYTGLPLVPAYLEGIVPEEQATEHTTQLMRWLARSIGNLPGVGDMLRVSPAVMENYVRGWSGGLGTYVVQGIDFAARQLGVLPDESLPAGGLESIPFIKAFIMRHPSMQAESIVSFYRHYDEASKNIGTLNYSKRIGDTELMQRYLPATVFRSVEQPRAALSKITKSIREVYHLPGMSPEEKRKMIESLYWQAIQVARYGNQMFYNARDVFNEQREQAELMRAQYPSLM